MDPFEVRMQFLGLLRKLNATQQSIQKVVGYALKYFSRCGEDLWECIIEECQKGSVNHWINILYFLDSLCESSLLAKAHQPPSAVSSSHAKQVNTSFLVDYVSRDLPQIVECVVPVGRQGLPNLTSTKQILENWRIKRIIDNQRVDEAMQLSSRQTQAAEASVATASSPASRPLSSRGSGSKDDAHLSRGEIFRRIEEDLQARPQVLSHGHPSHHSHSHSPAASSGPGSGSGFLPLSENENAELALDIEFENEWEVTSNWNEDDVEVVMEEMTTGGGRWRWRWRKVEELAEGEGGEEPMDLS
ncbi:hypothetical protein OG21DRAFT_1478068 [Imleria badia]|nr:hypothetical protein OG21DRAFT_1478068 [Imleria badia]